MLNLLFPIISKLDYWVISLLPFPFQNLLWGIIAGSIAFLIYLVTSNQHEISNIKNNIKIIRKGMFDPSLVDKSNYNKLAKRNLSLSIKLLSKILIPATLSIIPVLTIAFWYDTHNSYNIPFNEDKIAVVAEPTDPEITFRPENLVSEDESGNIYLNPQNQDDSLFIRINDQVIYSGLPFLVPVPVIAKKKWYNFLIGSENGYISQEASIEYIYIKFPRKMLYDNAPNIINRWEFLFFIGIFISAIPLRIIFKIQ